MSRVGLRTRARNFSCASPCAPEFFRRENKLMYHEQKNNMPKYVLTGTTTMGLVCRDGIVLGTDTRATLGTFVAHKRAKKVYQIDDHVAMTIAGGVADAQSVVETLRRKCETLQVRKRVAYAHPCHCAPSSQLTFFCPILSVHTSIHYWRNG